MSVFWVVTQCSLVEVCCRFRGASCLHHLGVHQDDIGLMMEAEKTSKATVNFYQLARCNNAEDSHLH
jgi:hypothetical protein